MPFEFPEKKDKEPKPKNFLSIISDMQGSSPEDFEKIGEKIKELEPKNIALLGDLFQSATIEEKGEKIKKGEITENNLTSAQKEIYDDFIKRGYPKIRAMMRSFFDSDEKLKEKDTEEIRSQAKTFFEKLAENKSDVHVLAGNIEVGYPWRIDIIKDELKNFSNIRFHNEPEFCQKNTEEGFIFWPSIDINNTNPEDLQKVVQGIEDEVKKSGVKKIFIFAHEYLFKGIKPSAYKEKLKEKNFTDKTHIIPWYMPNPTKLHILKLLRGLYAIGCDVKFIYGHIEDRPEITKEMVPFLKMNEQGITPKFRIGYDEKNKDAILKINNQKEVNKACVEMYQIPKNQIGKFETDKNNSLSYHLEQSNL